MKVANLIDARELEIDRPIKTDVVIVGSGAAGITLARRLSNKNLSVALVESGGFDMEGDTQSLFSGKNLGLPYFNLLACRLRYFGGTTNHWSGYCRANDPIDYEGRSSLGLPKWPVSHKDLAPYIAEAGNSLGVVAEHFDPFKLLDSKQLDTNVLLDDEVLQTKAFQLAKDIRLGKRYLDELKQQNNLTIYHHLNLCKVSVSETGDRVTSLECKTLNGKTHSVHAKHYVLCCHAIENSRILLTSNDVIPEGIGNAGDHVGRYFMDHIHIGASKFIPSSSFPYIYDWVYAKQHSLNVNLSFTDQFLRENGLLQYYCRFRPVFASAKTVQSVRSVMFGFKEPGDVQFLKDLASIIADPIASAKYVGAVRGIAHSHPVYYQLDHRIEQAPNPNSRVVISDRKDALGNPIADLNWQINDHDVKAFKVGQEMIMQKLSAMNHGRFELESIDRELVENRVGGHYHQIGTTRMSESIQDGVVDSNCKVHGVDNLYIGGSSVFPTAGYSGPTMMIIAFAKRLGDHLAARMEA